MSVRDGYSPTKAGEIPRGWQFVRLADACEIVGGSTPSKIVADYWNGDIPFATPTDITGLNGRNILDGTKSRITKKGFESISAKLLPPGSVLITSRATIGYCAINDSPVVTNQGFASLICKEGVHNLFMLYLMRSLKRKLERLATGSTFREVPRSSLRKLLISLPSYNEQQKIASVLLTVDEDIQKTDEIIAETQQLKKGLMQQLLTKGIGHTKFKKTEIGEIPEEWEVTKLGDVLKDIRYGTSAKANSQRKGFPVLGIPNVIEGRIEDKDLRQVELSEPETQATTIEEGDILIVRTNANPDYIGRCALFEKRMGTSLRVPKTSRLLSTNSILARSRIYVVRPAERVLFAGHEL